jgi:DNA-binding beta-propeller fold protein YncE
MTVTGTSIDVSDDPRLIAMASDGATAYVVSWLSGTVTPIVNSTDTPGPAIRVGAFPVAATFGPGASTLYIASFGGDSLPGSHRHHRLSTLRALPLGRVTTFGATCIPQVPPERLREVARAAEDEGLDELWLWEDCFWGGGIATAAAVLAWTTRLRVGIGVLPVPLRNVALTAMETATLHRLFPGRLTVGVGHGVQDWMGQVGARRESPVTLLREYIEALRSLLRGERVTTDGRYVRLDGVQLGWPPAAAPEVLAAARGPRTLRLSGEVADGAILDRVTTLEEFRTARESIEAGRTGAGRSGSHRIVQYMAADPGNAGAVAEAVRSWAASGADTVVLHPTSADQDPLSHIRFAAQVRPLL